MQNFSKQKRKVNINNQSDNTITQESIRVLVVDDDDQYRNMLELVLLDHGFQVITSCNGREAMEELQTRKIDLVVLDIIMPEQEGIETIQQIKQLYPDLKIIAISGGGPFLKASTSLHIAKNMGAHQVLQKPFPNKDLVNRIENLVLADFT